jgi:WD40 repeat protein
VWIRNAVRKAQIGTGIWVAVGVLIACAAGVAWWQKGIADDKSAAAVKAQKEAEQQRQLAQARQLAADANALAKGPRKLGMLALLLALQAHQRVPTSESFRALDSLTELLPEVIATYRHDRSSALSGSALEFSPDGKLLVSATGTTLIVFDVHARREVGRLTLPNEVRGARGVRTNREGTLLALSTGKRNESESAVLIRRFPGLDEVRTVRFRRAVADMAFSPGKLVAADRGGALKVIAISPGGADGELDLGAKVSAVALSSDGEAVAVAAGPNIRVMSTATGEVRRTIAPKLAKEEVVQKLVFSPDDKYLFSGTSEGMSATWTLSNEKDSVEKQERENHIDGVAWSGDGTRIAQIDAGEAYLCVWSAKDGIDLVASVTETEDSSGPSGVGAEFISGDRLVAWSQGPASIYALTQNKDQPRSQRCYDYDLRETSRLVLDSNIQRAATSKDRRFVAAMSGTGQIVIWRLSSQRPWIAGEVAESPKGTYLQVMDDKSLSIIAADRLLAPEEARLPVWKSSEMFATGEFSEDERYFAAVNKSRRVTVVDLTSSKVLTQVRVKAKDCRLRFVPHKGTLLMASGGQIQELNLKTLTVRQRLTYTTRQTEVFSPSGRYFAARELSSEGAKDDKRLELYDLERGQKLRDFQVNSFDRDVRFSADERLIASPQNKDVVSVWDIESGRQQCQCPAYTVALEFAFSPDSKRIAVSKGDTVRVWDVGDGKLTLEAKREAGEYGSLAFSPDSAALAVGSRDYSVLPGVTLWSIPDGRLLIDVPFDKQIQSVRFSKSGQYLMMFQILWQGNNQSQELRTSWYLWKPEDVIARANKRKTRELDANEWRRYLPTEPLPNDLK